MRLPVAIVLMGVAGICPDSGAGERPESAGELPFHRGVNLTNWLQGFSVGQIQFARFTKQDFENIKSLGCDVIRLPMDLYSMTYGAPDYTVQPRFLSLLDQIVDWSEELELHLIFDNCGFATVTDTSPNEDQILAPIWTQMAEHYKDRAPLLCYEILNEPHGISDARWGQIQQTVIDAIRAVDPNHTIVVTGAEYGSYNNLKYLPAYPDDNLIYTFHFYDPFVFTHQGTDWLNPSMASLGGVPFPYGVDPVPVCPPALEGTWVEGALNWYTNDGTVAHVKSLIDIAAAFQNTRRVTVFCGEFGVYRLTCRNEHRVAWYETVRQYLEEKGIAWTSWDYQGGFGLFQAGTNELFEHDLNVPLVAALGLTAPEQTPLVITPERTGFSLYDDAMAPGLSNAGWIQQGTVDFYWDVEPAEGTYCLYCAGLACYNNITFDFRPDKDLSLLVQGGSALQFWARGDTPSASVEIRFIDTKTSDPQDHPWRMGMAVDGTVIHWDGEWHLVRVPLKNLQGRGSWDGDWFGPPGAFDWKAVDWFQIVAEQHDFVGMQFWFDDIRVTNPDRGR
jgi:endoglucanase